MMIKKFRGFDYIRVLSFLAAVYLLFAGLLIDKGPPSIDWPAVQGRRGGDTSAPFQFAVIADIHKGWGVFKPIMKEIAIDGYSFAIIGGDIIAQNKEDRYRFFFKELAEVRGKIPIYFVPGNHDVYDYGYNAEYSLENFLRYCGPDHYWFSWGDAAFVVVNDSRSRLTNREFHWLEDTLRMVRKDFTHIFVSMHVPSFDPREGQSYCLPKSDGERFMALMEKYRVDYVFSGHIHCYFRKVINGVTYIGCPSAGGTTRCSNPTYGYIQIAVHGQGLKDSVVKVDNDWWLELMGDIKYDVRVRRPFLIPLLTVVLGQSFFYFLAL
jgi:predicted phosphodiesterase